MYGDMKRDFIDSYDGWSVGADGVLTCPCGYRVEDDGECPEGHTSPMRAAGII